MPHSLGRVRLDCYREGDFISLGAVSQQWPIHLSLFDGVPASPADVKFMGQQGRLVTAGADKTACIWQADAEGTYTAAAVLKDHTAEVCPPPHLFIYIESESKIPFGIAPLL